MPKRFDAQRIALLIVSLGALVALLVAQLSSVAQFAIAPAPTPDMSGPSSQTEATLVYIARYGSQVGILLSLAAGLFGVVHASLRGAYHWLLAVVGAAVVTALVQFVTIMAMLSSPANPFHPFVVMGILPLVVLAYAVLSRRDSTPGASEPVATGRFSGFRTGVLAVPMYLFFMGAGHIWLSQVMPSQFENVPRDGQAFAELFVLGLFSILIGVVMAVVALGRERGVVGEIPCIVEQGREICQPGDGTYIKSARPDVLVMFLLGPLFAYGAAHLFGRVRLGK
jgi:hypothetical protein